MNKIIFHIDANCFFASCEELINNKLINKPFVVCNNHQYAVISCPNKIARKYKIKAAMNLDEAKILCNELITVEPNFDWYEKKSLEMFTTIKNFLDTDVEIMSIDECYVDVTHIVNKFHNNVEILAYELIKYIKFKTGLSVTVGAGNNKFLAKTAGDSKPINKFAHIYNDEIKTKVWTKSINDIFSIGKKSSQLLKNLEIKTVQDFINFKDQKLLEQKLMKRYFYLKNSFYGLDNDVIDANNLEKSISQSKTFIEPTENEEFIKNTIKWLNDELNQILTSRNLVSNNISVYIKFYEANSISQKSKNQKLSIYTNEKLFMLKSYKYLFNNLWKGQKIKTLGISANDIKKISEINKQNKLSG